MLAQIFAGTRLFSIPPVCTRSGYNLAHLGAGDRGGEGTGVMTPVLAGEKLVPGRLIRSFVGVLCHRGGDSARPEQWS